MLVDIIHKFIVDKYREHLIIDNAGSHRNNMVKDDIIASGNNFLFSVPYTPKTNGAIEAYFNKIK